MILAEEKFSDGILAASPSVEQGRASDPCASVWVGASAGSGKTKVLVDRVLRLLLSGAEPQKILCLTFTRAAAAEMSMRVSKRLAKWATCSEEALRKELYELQNDELPPDLLEESRRLFAKTLDCPGGMRIMTIHSFAQEILKRFPIEAGITPNFAVLDAADAFVLRKEAENAVFRDAVRDDATGKALRIVAQSIAETQISELVKKLLDEAEKIKSAALHHGGYEKMAAKTREIFGLSKGEDKDNILLNACRDENFPRDDIMRAAKILLENKGKKSQERGETILDWLSFSMEKRVSGFEEYSLVYLTKKETIRDICSNDILNKYPEVVDIISKEAQRLLEAKEKIAAAFAVELNEAALLLMVRIEEEFAKRKEKLNAMDFGDLIAKAGELLRRPGIAPWVLFKLDGGIDHVMVDEAQDTNPDQWRIITAITEEFFSGMGARQDVERTLFVVGDEKQSIFSFQGADPKEFDRMREYFKGIISAADKEYREVPLNVSFRSAPAVLKAVDAVFADEKNRAGVSKGAISHKSHRSFAEGRVEVWPLVEAVKNKEEKTEEWNVADEIESKTDAADELAGIIALKIKKWLDDKEAVYDKKTGKKRAMTAGDVMILVQKRNNIVPRLLSHMKKIGVPVAGADRMDLTNNLAVKDLMSLLQFALLPEDDLNLAEALRSPVLGCGDEELLALAAGRRGSLWDSLKAHAGIDEKFEPICGYLKNILAEADKITPYAMLAKILSEPCPSDKISGKRAIWKRLGNDAEDPINELLSAALNFSERNAPSLQSFSCWMKASKTEIKRELEQGHGHVRIITVHSSKGLEAPVVIIPDAMVSADNSKNLNLLWDEKNKLPLLVMNGKTRVTSALLEEEKKKQREESRRLLYVAMTRAADRLYIGGWKPGRSSGDAAWYNMIVPALRPLHDANAVKNEEIFAAEIAIADIVAPSKEEDAEFTAIAANANEDMSLPNWTARRPEPEPKPPRPLVPSRLDDEDLPIFSPNAASLARGRIIHRLLQSLPDLDEKDREKAAMRYLSNPIHGLSGEKQKAICSETLSLLNHKEYSKLFSIGSKAEVPISAVVGDRVVSGQMDRIFVSDKEVWIVDYKTNRPPPDVADKAPRAYMRQLAAYRFAAQKIYPDKKIRCFLLWTFCARLMEVPEEFLAAA